MISVVIPTHKQEYLARTLRALLKAGKDSDFEVIVCENPEVTPETKAIVDSMGPKVSLVYSSAIGSNNARNVGIHFAKGDIIALTDDDCEVDINWFDRIRSAFENPKIACLGGRVDLKLDKPKSLSRMQASYLTELNHGRTEFPRKINSNEYLVSCNLAFTKSVYKLVGGFNSEIGYKGKQNFIANDELLFIRDSGNFGDVVYDHDFIVNHIVNEYRSSMKYFIRRAYGQGYANVILSRLQDQHPMYHEPFYETPNNYDLILQFAKSMGVTHGILGIEPCERYYLLLEELVQN